MSLVRHVRLRVPSGSARPGPSIGQALGPLGINMAEFCKQFNERTVNLYEKDVPLGVRLAAMSDRSFTFQVRSPPTAYLIKRCLGKQNEKGPTAPSVDKPWGYITPEAVYEIAKLKQTGAFMAAFHLFLFAWLQLSVGMITYLISLFAQFSRAIFQLYISSRHNQMTNDGTCPWKELPGL